MNNKLKKKILINLLLLMLMFSISEFYFWNKQNENFDVKLPFFKMKLKDSVSCYPAGRFGSFKETYSQKAPILLLGCSYAYGEFISLEDNFASKLTNLSGRWVYNFGEPGQGPIYSLLSLELEKKEPLITVEPEYVIYLYMFHHPNRWYFTQYYDYYRKQNWIPFQKHSVLDNFYTFRYFRNMDIDKYFHEDENLEKRMDLFFKMMNEIKNKSKELYPDSKFVFLIYSDVNKDLCEGLMNSVKKDSQDIEKMFEIMNSKQFKHRLEAMDMQVITTEELINRKMVKQSDRAENDPHYPHPSASAWDEVIPKLIKKLKL